jgi:AraC-like DNA-binding protein
VDIYSTANAPRRARAAYWNSVYSSRFAQVTFRPGDDDDFEAELRVGKIGPLGVARVHSNTTDIERDRFHIRRSEGRIFSFLLQARGSAVFSHYGRETRLEAGDFTLCDNAMPHNFHCNGANELIILRAPPELLRSYMPYPERLCGLRLPATSLFAEAAAKMAHSLWRQLETGIPECYSGMVVRNMLDVLATSYAMSFAAADDESSTVVARRIQARSYVEAHLREADLTPSRIADALHISSRYLRMLFESEQESVTGFILRRRLEECARQIGCVLWRGHTITAIAFSCGFNSAAHFTRAFRDRFSMTPTEYRRQHCASPER